MSLAWLEEDQNTLQAIELRSAVNVLFHIPLHSMERLQYSLAMIIYIVA